MSGARLEKTGGVFARIQYVEDFLEPRTTQMPVDRLPQQNGMTRTDSWFRTVIGLRREPPGALDTPS